MTRTSTCIVIKHYTVCHENICTCCLCNSLWNIFICHILHNIYEILFRIKGRHLNFCFSYYIFVQSIPTLQQSHICPICITFHPLEKSAIWSSCSLFVNYTILFLRRYFLIIWIQRYSKIVWLIPTTLWKQAIWNYLILTTQILYIFNNKEYQSFLKKISLQDI